MALAFADLKTRRAALLLRSQQAREDRQRLLFRQAEQARTTAEADVEAARASQLTQAIRAEKARAIANARLRGLVVGHSEIAALAGFEDDLARESDILAKQLRAAEDHVARVRAESTAARTALQAQARAKAKRSRVADEFARQQRIEQEASEDRELDEQRADTCGAS